MRECREGGQASAESGGDEGLGFSGERDGSVVYQPVYQPDNEAAYDIDCQRGPREERHEASAAGHTVDVTRYHEAENASDT